MTIKANKLKKRYFEIVQNFLIENGKKILDKNHLTTYSYQGESLYLVLGEFMNGNGFYIQSPTMLIISYSKPKTIVKKRGLYKELEHYANNLDKIQAVRKLIHKKSS
jgi:hypothetical protein